jgi:hypothetical protein
MTREWIHGLISAFVGGLSGAASSGITLLIVAPNEFNLGEKLAHTVTAVGILSLLTGAQVAFAYLKNSPTPWDGTPETDQRVIPAQTPVQKAVAADVVANAGK